MNASAGQCVNFGPAYRVFLIDKIDDFAGLQPAWDALWSRSDKPYQSQSFNWAWAGYHLVAKPRGGTLAIVVVWDRDRLVLIWPFSVRSRRLTRVAYPLGSESTEYGDVLVEPGPAVPDLIDMAYRFLCLQLRADWVRIPFIRVESPLAKLLQAQRSYCIAHTLPASYASISRYGSWEDYWKTRSANLRSGLKRRIKRLEEKGAVRTGFLTDPQERQTAVTWTLDQKRRWLARTHQRNDFLNTPEYEAFIRDRVGAHNTGGSMYVKVLWFKNKIIASEIGCVDPLRFEGFISTYDPAFQTWSPGQILNLACMKWCFKHTRDYDFRIGRETYKSEWADGSHDVTAFDMALTSRGAIALRSAQISERLREARDALRAAIPTDHRKRVKRALRRLIPDRWGGTTVVPSAVSGITGNPSPSQPCNSDRSRPNRVPSNLMG